MQQSHLQIELIHFYKIIVETEASPCLIGNIEITDSVGFFQNEDDPHRWEVKLLLEITVRSVEGPPAYSGKLGLLGQFRIIGELSETTSVNLVRINGPAILYSTAREMFCNLTARGPSGMVQLPAKTFIDLKLPERKEKQTQETEKKD